MTEPIPEPIPSEWVDRMMKIIPASFVFTRIMFVSPRWYEVEDIFTNLHVTENPEAYPNGYHLSGYGECWRVFEACNRYLFPYISHCLNNKNESSFQECMKFFNDYIKSTISAPYLEDSISFLYEQVGEKNWKRIIGLLDNESKEEIIASVGWLGEDAMKDMAKFLSSKETP